VKLLIGILSRQPIPIPDPTSNYRNGQKSCHQDYFVLLYNLHAEKIQQEHTTLTGEFEKDAFDEWADS